MPNDSDTTTSTTAKPTTSTTTETSTSTTTKPTKSKTTEPKSGASKQIKSLKLCARCKKMKQPRNTVATCLRYCPYCNRKYWLCQSHSRTYTLCNTRLCKRPFFAYQSHDPRVRKWPNTQLNYQYESSL